MKLSGIDRGPIVAKYQRQPLPLEANDCTPEQLSAANTNDSTPRSSPRLRSCPRNLTPPNHRNGGSGGGGGCEPPSESWSALAGFRTFAPHLSPHRPHTPASAGGAPRGESGGGRFRRAGTTPYALAAY